MKYGRENSPPESPVREINPVNTIMTNGNVEANKEGAEVVIIQKNYDLKEVIFFVIITGGSKRSSRILNMEIEA